MTTLGWVLLGIGVVLAVGVIALYNSLVTWQNRVRNAWAQIDVQLKRRHDLIPNLVEVCRAYMRYERETLEAIIKARQQAIGALRMDERASAENQVSRTLRQLFAVVERYPQLKASENLLALQEELASTENKIAFARQFYNDCVMEHNTQLFQFPSNLIAATLMAVMVGTIALLCDVFWRSVRYGGRRRSKDGSHLIFLLFPSALAILAPIVAKLIQLAMSRRREFLADATAALLTRYPEGLASALEKIDSDQEVLEAANRATQHLYIVNPIKAHEERAKGWLATLFSTHPPTAERVQRLRAMTGKPELQRTRNAPAPPSAARPVSIPEPLAKALGIAPMLAAQTSAPQPIALTPR